MLITARFLVINVPKSGSSFVRAAIKAVFARRRSGRWWWPVGRRDRLRELMLPNIRLPGRARDQHGTVAQIPARYRDRAIVSVMRDPYAKTVSEYRFRWWATHPPLAQAELHRLFPAFPDLDLDDYLRLADHVAARKVAETMGVSGPVTVGNLTVEFLQFFFPDPAAAYRRLSDDYVRSGAFRADMAEVRFLRQEALGPALAGFLAEQGFTADEAALARAHAPVNVTPRRNTDDRGWTAWGLAHFAARERYLLAMQAALGFHYPPPSPDGERGGGERGDIAPARS